MKKNLKSSVINDNTNNNVVEHDNTTSNDNLNLTSVYSISELDNYYKKSNSILNYCPSCGRENLNLSPRCKYCCALTSLDDRISLKFLNKITIILFIISVIYFIISANLKPYYVNIANLNESLNFQHVRVLAKVLFVNEYKDKYGKKTTIQIELEDVNKKADDASDEYNDKIKLKIEGEVANELKDKGLIPACGDIVDVSATLYAGRDYRILSLGSAEMLKVVTINKDNIPISTTIEQLLNNPNEFKNKKVQVNGFIKSKRGQFIIEISDNKEDSNKTLIVFGIDSSIFKINQKVSVIGKFVYYEKGEYWEIKVNREQDVEILEEGNLN